MKITVKRIFIVGVLHILSSSFAMGVQEVSSVKKLQKVYDVNPNAQSKSTKKWRASLTGLFSKDKLKNKKHVATKFEEIIPRDDRRSFSLVPKPTQTKRKCSSAGNAGSMSLLSLMEEQDHVKSDNLSRAQKEEREYQLALRALSREAGVISRSSTPEMEEPAKLQEVMSSAQSKNPGLSVSQILLARKVKIKRETYAAGRSGRDSQTKFTAREYLGKKGDSALNLEGSEEVSVSSKEELTPRSSTDDTITPRTEETCSPRLDEDIVEIMGE